MLHLDFETRSEAEIRNTGAWVYSLCPSTEVLCLAWAVNDGPVRLWYPDKFLVFEDQIEDLYQEIKTASQIAAFNSWFERAIWENIMVPRHAAPPVRPEQWYCVMGQSKAHSLPGSLEEVGAALHLPVQKDKEGRRLMLKMCKPRRPTKNNPAKWHETPEDLTRLGEYCRRDVETERLIHQTLPELTPREREIWLANQEMNYRGFGVDLKTLSAVLPLLNTLTANACSQLIATTSGQVETPGQVARILDFVKGQGIELPNLQKDTLESALNREDLPPTVRDVLEIRRAHGLASVKKFQTMKNSLSPDGTLKGCLTYCGAARTRRWSGARVQPQNFVRGFEEQEDIEAVINYLQMGELEFLEMVYGSPLKAISNSMRGFIMAPGGYEFICSDFSSIEAVLTAAIVGVELLLEDFRQNRQPYITMATKIYNRSYEEIFKGYKAGDKTAKDQRFFGKQAVLGLGYSMGPKKYRDTCAKYGKEIEQDFAEHIVSTYRNTYHQLPVFWKKIEADAKSALINKKPVWRKYYGFQPHRLGLMMVLPNGSERFYIDAKVMMKEKFGQMRPCLTYMGQDQYTRKWKRLDTYGGKLLENLVQSTARELQADAILALETAGYRCVLQVHDEIVACVPKGFGSVDEFENIMQTSSSWAADWPIKAAGGWRGERYRK